MRNLIAALAIGVLAACASKTDYFTGTWYLDGANRKTSGRLVITQEGSNYIVAVVNSMLEITNARDIARETEPGLLRMEGVSRSGNKWDEQIKRTGPGKIARVIPSSGSNYLLHYTRAD